MKSLARAARAVGLFGLLLVVAACSKPAAPEARRVKFYQSPMHPWITADKPGNCTICGMALVPVYEGEPGAAAAKTNDVALTQSGVHALGVATVPVGRVDLTRTLRLSGVFEDDDNLHRVVAAFYDGRIDRVYVDHVGQFVTRGTPLAAIYSPELLYVVRELQTATQAGEAAVAASSARRLVQYGLPAEQVAALARQRQPASTIDLLAPDDGTIVVRSAIQGQYIKTGEPLFELGNLARLWFHAEVYERDVPLLRAGQPATLTTPTVPGRDFPGVVTFIDPNFDPTSRSTKVRIEVDNPLVPGDPSGGRRIIPHRAYGEARVTVNLGPALVVPASAVLRDGRRSVAYIETAPGRYEPRAVRLGRSGDDGIEVLSGLAEGERVVATGNLLIDAEAQLRASGEPTTP